MNDAVDPFAFHQLPSITDQVNETFGQLRYPVTDKPTLHALLTTGLAIPVGVQDDPALWLKTAAIRLKRITTTIQLARAHCAPYRMTESDLTESFLCACTMLHLPGRLNSHLIAVAKNPVHKRTVFLAYATHYDLRKLNAQPMPTSEMFFNLGPESKLLAELYATMKTALALASLDNENLINSEELNSYFVAISRYRPLLQRVDSAMARRFRSLNEILIDLKKSKGLLPNGGGEVVTLKLKGA